MLISSSSERPRTVDDLLDPAVVARLERLDIRSLKMFPGKLQGERRSKKRGQSVEFADYRNYVPGDDLRFVDWNAYARLNHLFVKIFLEEEDLALHVVVDASASMDAGRPSKLRFASELGLALAAVGLTKQNRVGMSVFGAPGQERIRIMPEARGRRHIHRFGQFLLDEVWTDRESGGGESGPDAAFNRALRTIAQMRIGKGVLVLLSDYLIPEGYEDGLRALAAAGGYDIYCVQVLAPGEVEPESEARTGLTGDLRLTDAESGRAAEVTLTPQLIRKYKQRLNDYTQALHNYCLARDMTHTLVRSDADVAEVVLDTLRRQGMVG